MASKYYEENREKLKADMREYNRVNGTRIRSTFEARVRRILNNAQTRAKKNGLKCTLTFEWIGNRLERCELTGIQFDLTLGKGAGPRSPSIDRIDNSGDYTPENCRMICWALNSAFNRWGEDEFRKIAERWII